MGVFSKGFSWALSSPTVSSVDKAGDPSVIANSLSNPGAIGWLMGFGNKTDSGANINPYSAMQITTAFAAIRNICEDIAKTKPYLYRRIEAADGVEQGRERVKKGPIAKLLRKPNRWMDRFQFIEFIVLSMLLRGNAYVVIMRNNRGDPIALIPIMPDKVTMLESPNGDYFYRVSAASFTERAQLNGRDPVIPSEDIMHIKMLSADGKMGLSPISQNRETLGIAVVSKAHHARMLGQGAQPVGVLETDKAIAAPAMDRLKNDWAALQSGYQNTGKTPILEDGMKWKQVGLSSVDMEFLASQKFNVEEICRIFRIPPHVVGHLEKATNNNIEHQGLEYLTRCLSPIFERIETSFDDSFDLTEKDLEIEFDKDSLNRADMTNMVRALSLAVTSSWMEPSEARLKFGMNRHKDGNKLMQGNNQAAGGLKNDPPETDPAGGKDDKRSHNT